MRLIDDDALLKAWDNLSERGRKEFDQVIMTQPTAYDIEKVVAELVEFAFESMDKVTYDSENYYDGVSFAIRKAIEIVKRNSD